MERGADQLKWLSCVPINGMGVEAGIEASQWEIVGRGSVREEESANWGKESCQVLNKAMQVGLHGRVVLDG